MSATPVGEFPHRNRATSLPERPPCPPIRTPPPPTRTLRAMHIRDWPTDERPREKLLARGAGALSDAELLAIFLGSGLRGQDAVATARDLLNAHGPLRALLERTPPQLARLPGLGPARACLLAAALELGHRHLAAELERGEALDRPAAPPATTSPSACAASRTKCSPRCSSTPRHRALAFEELFRGTVDGAEVHPREVVAPRAGPQRRGGDRRPQPSQRQSRTQRRRPRRHRAPAAGAGAGRRAPARPLRRSATARRSRWRRAAGCERGSRRRVACARVRLCGPSRRCLRHPHP